MALASSASAAVTQKQAAKKALAALGTEKRSDPVIVFGLPKPLKAGTRITQAGTSEPTKGSKKGIDSRLRAAGVRTVKAPAVLTVTTRSYFFYEDRGPYQLYQHPGRVAIVDAESGKVRLSQTIDWPPLLNGRLPAFLKSAGGYRSSKYQVLNRPYAIDGNAQQPRVAQRNLFDQDPFGPGRPLPDMANSKAIADRLAAERSCVLRVTDTLPSFWNVNELNLTRSYVGTLFEKLERDNAGFVDDRYGARSGETLGAAVDGLIEKGCKDILLYIAGQGYDQDGEPVIQLGTSTLKGGLLAQQNISATDLRNLVSARSGVTFKFKFDAPYSGGFVGRLSDLKNVVLVETPASEGTTAFSFVPQVSQNGQMTSDGSNPAGLLSFTNCELVGFKAFFSSAEEIDKATQGQNEGVSFLAEMLARSQELCKGVGFADDLGSNPQLYASQRASGRGTNLPPKADPQSVKADEDTAKAITLSGSDPDNDSLTFTITKQPDHGTLSGSGANVTYTPAANYNGPDDFSFRVTDSKGADSNTAKVSIDVGAGNDAPVVTNSQNATAYTEQAAAVVVDGNVTVSDIDDTQIEGATVRVSAGFQSGDALVFADQLGITGTYNSGTGVLTLTGSASVSDYQTALRDIRYRNLSNDNPSSPKTVEFKVNDGTADSAASTKNLAVTGVNDRPELDTTNAPLAYEEGDGEVPVDKDITAADPDSTNLVGATVQITSNHVEAEDDLTFDNGNGLGITGNYTQNTGTLVLSGTASVANYQAALRLVKYVNNSNNPSTVTRTVSFQADDGGAANNLSTIVTRDITVGPVDDGPDAVNDSAIVNEDSGANALNVFKNDTDVDGGPMEIESVSDPAHGAATIVQGSPDTIEYTPDANYCNNPPNTTPDTFTYTVNGGDTATVSVRVDCIDDNPVAVNDAVTTKEDAVNAAINVLANDTDVDGGPRGIQSITQPTNGTTTINDSGTPGETADDFIRYTPNANYCNSAANPAAPDTFTYTLTPGGSTATVSVTVNCVDDAPVAVNDPVTVGEDSGNAQLNSLTANDTDIDGGPKHPVSVTQPTNGSASVDNAGTPGDATDDVVVYRPNANYCNSNANPAAPDTFNYTLNGGSSATVSVTVTCVDDAPTAVNDVTTVTEDSSNNAVDVKVNDTDIDGGPMSITGVGDSANGSTQINNNGTPGDASDDFIGYTPDDNYCNSNPSGTPDTFTYTLNGGSTATVSVTVTCADDAPTAVNDAATVDEDTSNNAIDVLANDTDPDAGTKSVDQVTQPANGSVTITGGGTGVQYTPNANYCNTPPPGDTFTYTLNGGSTATVTVTVACIDDPTTAVDDSATVTEDSTDNAIDVLANDTDVDTKRIASKTDPANGSVTLTGGTTGSHTGLTYTPDPNYCNSTANPAAPDTFTYQTVNGTSATVSVTVTCVDDAPVAVNDAATVNEDSGATTVPVTSNDTDDDGGPKYPVSVTQPANGTAAVNNNGTPGDATDDFVTYTPNANYCNSTANPAAPDTFTYTLNGAPGSSATVSMTVTCLPDPPSVSLDNNALTYNENEAAKFVDENLDVSAPDAPLQSATVTISAGFDSAQDELTFTDSVIDNITMGYNDTTGVLTLTAGPGGDTPENFELALRTVKYQNVSDAPTTSRTITVQATDTNAASGSDSRAVTIAPSDDPPVAVNDPATVTEDDPATAIPVLTNDTDVDGGAKGIQSVTQPANGAVVITGGGTGLTYKPNANYCNTQQGGTADTFTYKLAPGSSEATVSVTVTCVNDAPVAVNDTYDGAESAIGNTRLAVSTSPSSPKKTITGNVLTDDTENDGVTDDDKDVDGPGPLIVKDTDGAANGNGTTSLDSALGGKVLINSDGTFVYDPPSTHCSNPADTFTYTLSDQGTPEGTSTAVVTIKRAGCVWYVDDDNPAADLGTSHSPYSTVTAAEASSAAGHTVFVFDDAGTAYSTGSDGYQMDSAERLIGQHEALEVDADGAGAVHSEIELHPASPGAHPDLTSTTADVVKLNDGVELKGFNVDPSGANNAICGGVACGGLASNGSTIDDVNIDDDLIGGSQPGLELNGTTGTHTITDLTYNTGAANPSTAAGISLNSAGTVNFGPGDAGDPTKVNKNGGPALVATGSSTKLGGTFDEITVVGSGTGGVNLDTIHSDSSTTFGDGSGTDLNISTSGPTAAFRAVNAGTVQVHANGTANVESTGALPNQGGPAVQVTGTSTGNNPPTTGLNFDIAKSTNSSTNGIELSGLGTGTFSGGNFSGNSVGGYAGTGFKLTGGSGDVTYNGVFLDASGDLAVDIANRTGGVNTFPGTVIDSNDNGGGISITGTTGGSTRFTDFQKQLNTGSIDAVNFVGSNGHTLNFLNGGLAIATTSGRGIDAENSGVLNVEGTTNTVLTDTGRGINVADTDIAATGMTFRSVRVNSDLSGNGPDHGIRLEDTGTAGSLAVAGSGGNCTSTASCTGGVIHNTTSDGVRLTRAAGTSLTDLYVGDSDGTGIHAPSGTSNNNFNDLHVHNNGDAVSDNANGIPEAGIAFGPMTGTNTITGTDADNGATTVQQSRNNQIQWNQTTGTGTLNITNTDVLSNGQGAGTGQNGIWVESSGTATATVNVGAGGNGTGDVDITSPVADGYVVNATGVGATANSDLDNVNLTGPGAKAVSVLGRGTNVFRLNNSDLNGFNIAPNNLSAASTVNINPIETANLDASVLGNRIGTAGQTRSGAAGFYGIVAGFENDQNVQLNISNNIIRETAHRGIYVYAADFANPATGAAINMDLTMHNNNVAAPVGAAVAPEANTNAILVTADDNTNACADFTGNEAVGRGTAAALRVRQLGTAFFAIEGLGANTTTDTVVEQLLANRNPSIAQAEIDADSAFATTAGWKAQTGNCPEPILPP